MKEINAKMLSRLLMTVSLFSICKPSCHSPSPMGLLLFQQRFPVPAIMTLQTLPLLLGSFPSAFADTLLTSQNSRSTRAVTGLHNSTTATANSSTSPKTTAKPGKLVKEKILVIPDRSPANYTPPVRDDSDSGDTDNGGSSVPSNITFNFKAFGRTLIVISGIAVIIISYLGIKCFFGKGKPFGSPYGIVETSEMDLLDKMEEDEEESEEEELFDINSHRRPY